MNNCSCCKQFISHIKSKVLDTSNSSLKREETSKHFYFTKVSDNLYGEVQNLSPLKALQTISRKVLG